MKSFFSPKEVARLIGISYRQIQYWDDSGFIKPSYRRRGRYRLYTFFDLTQLWIAQGILKSGGSVQGLRKTIKIIKELASQMGRPISDLTFLIKKNGVLAFSGEMFGTGLSDYLRFEVKSLAEKIDATFPLRRNKADKTDEPLLAAVG
jgi:DNA-binding transcriptional MerR regulator